MSISDYFADSTPGFGRQQDIAAPDILRAGDSLAWTAKWSGYPSGAGWALAYILNSPTARFVVAPADIVAQADLVSWAITIPASETKLWTPGSYQWIAAVTLGTQRITTGLGEVVILPDLIDATGPIDTRSAAEVNLATVEASLAARASGGVDSYMIAGRELKYMPIAELFRLRSHYRQLVRQEQIDRGELAPSNTVVVQFGDCGPGVPNGRNGGGFPWGY